MNAFVQLSADHTPVPRCSIHDRDRLLGEFVLRSRPVVVPDAAQLWPALEKWKPAFFRRHYGHISTRAGQREISIADYVDLMLRSSPDQPAPYPFSFDIEKYFPELLQDIQPQPAFHRLNRLDHPLMRRSFLSGTRRHEIFFGGNGSYFPFLHYDALHLHGHITQILGDKEFYLFPPEQGALMYPSSDNEKFSRINDPFDPDLERFPLYAQARPHAALLQPGETIFFPAGWWHVTRIFGPCISYGGVGLTSANWSAFVRDNARLRSRGPRVSPKALALLSYGSLAGALMRVQELFMA
jgi:hypothetical protein